MLAGSVLSHLDAEHVCSMRRLLSHVTIASGGVLPQIHAVLLPKTKASKGKKAGATADPEEEDEEV